MSAESTVSDHGDTRFSTPVPELDDHRLQLGSIPRAKSRSTDSQRRLTPDDAPDACSSQRMSECLLPARLLLREFEQAVADEDKSGTQEHGNIREQPSSDVQSPHVARQLAENTVRERRKSSDSSSASSSSPPNSVEAFAGPRRRERANTLESYAPSIVDIVQSRQRALSGATQPRRPTISNGSLGRVETCGKDDGGALGEDVCFPLVEDTGKVYTIDFEELEEFVALCAQGHIPSASHIATQQRTADTLGEKPRVFHDLRQHNLPRIIRTSSGTCGESLTHQPSFIRHSSDRDEFDEKDILQQNYANSVQATRFRFFSSAIKDLQCASHLGGLVNKDTTFRDLFELPAEGGGVWWLDVENPTKDELVAISKAFHIHPLTLEDIETQEAREKVEIFHQYYFVTFRTFVMDKDDDRFLDPINVYVIVFRDGLLTFSYATQPHCQNVRRRIGKMSDHLSLGADWICYALIDNIVDSFGPVIRDAERESENIEDQVFIAREDDYAALLKQIGVSRKRVLNLMRLLGGKADLIRGFAKRCNAQFAAAPRADIGLYLGDIQDHVVTMMSNLGHVEKMLSRSHGNYLAQLNVDNLVRGNHTNDVLSKITLVATILVPLNLICGLFGMNVPVPGKDSTGFGWFFGILGIIAAIVIFSLMAARRLKAI